MPYTRRLIRSMLLERNRGSVLEVKSHTSGAITVSFASRHGDANALIEMLRDQVREMGYEPIFLASGADGPRRWVRFCTEEAVGEQSQGGVLSAQDQATFERAVAERRTVRTRETPGSGAGQPPAGATAPGLERIRSTEPLSRREFDARLRDWHARTGEERVGDGGSYGAAPWLWVRHEGILFHLNADTRRQGVEEYLERLDAEPDLLWILTEGRTDKLTKVVFGRARQAIPGFYLYAKDAEVRASQMAPPADLPASSPPPASSPGSGFASLLIGRTLGGRYQVGSVLGRGGMGVVYRGTDERLGRPVAIKVIAAAGVDAESQERLRRRFQREARSAAGIHHPNVVAVFDYGTDDVFGLDYLVMELLNGRDLSTVLRQKGRAPLHTAISILEQAARGVGAGHRAGLVHRDVKPANLFLERAEAPTNVRVRVLDFGIAQIADVVEDTLTHLTLFGSGPLSPAFASPEQLQGVRDLTPASDVYSLAVTGFELLTGTRPFDPSLVKRISANEPVQIPSVRDSNPSIPEQVDRVLQKAMHLVPTERYRNASEFAEALAPGMRGSDRLFRPPIALDPPKILDHPELADEAMPDTVRSPATRPATAPDTARAETLVASDRFSHRHSETPSVERKRVPSAPELEGRILQVTPEVLRRGNPRRPYTHGWLAFEVLLRAPGGRLRFEDYRQQLFNAASEIRALAEQIPGVPNAYQDLKHIRHDIRCRRVRVESQS